MLSDLASKVVEKLMSPSGLAAGLLFLTAFGSALYAYLKVEEHKSVRDFLSFAFPKEVIMHPSARADLLFWITKRAIMPFFLIPFGFGFVAAVAYGTNQLIGGVFHLDGPLLGGPASPWVIVLFTLTMLVAYDIS